MEQFHYTTKAGKQITLPRMDNVKAGLLRKLRHESEVNMMFGLLESLLTEPDLAIVDEMTQAELTDFMTGWGKSSSTDLGESSAS